MRPMTTDHSELDTPGHDDSVDDHAHDEEPLGPIDLASWGAGALGIVVGVAVALCFALATA
jgi:hypothetical protein